ncbi:atpase f0 complex subunit a active site [Lucifera butyrica]|uniref:ATP synthase subunit a n=1 Tax=Lucifera butyrica TaxID=1351585 RepID=A0A498RDD5_9FIRM|nr:F0F1 ATP synthase subunit A [Lucifera butyrica]VBB08927.1 atpase f0 complex subunit a active site [Lucifera butyrica]
MEHGGGADIGVHKLAHLAGLTFNMDTLYMTWLAMAIVILIAVLATRKLELVPRGWQNLLEMAVTALLDQIEGAMGPNGKKLSPLIITLFLFLLIANWLGLVPGLSSPTNDINTTMGLALMVVVLVHILGVKNRGIVNYVKHFFQPFIPFVIINLIEELAKPVTLAFRLFGNILAGEVMIIILGMLVPKWIPVPNIVWLGFSVFVGLVQAFIFTMLSMSYLANSVNNEHH